MARIVGPQKKEHLTRLATLPPELQKALKNVSKTHAAHCSALDALERCSQRLEASERASESSRWKLDIAESSAQFDTRRVTRHGLMIARQNTRSYVYAVTAAVAAAVNTTAKPAED